MNNVIEIRDLQKHYGSGAGQVRALDSVDLDVRSGEVLVLMGPSGKPAIPRCSPSWAASCAPRPAA